jgi:isochorismate synthase
MNSFALYRLPHAKTFTLVEGPVETFLSCGQLNGRRGFVVAPFEVSPEQPIVLITPKRIASDTMPVMPQLPETTLLSGSSRSTYAIDFANFHAQLLKGTFRKIVLARCADETLPEDLTPLELFLRACNRYPRLFISLFYTPQSGMWLTATPEILLDCENGMCRTIALAGTMRLEGKELEGEGENVRWSIKNVQEQRYVATYMAECLEHVTSDFREDGPRTVRAAHLVHLRSDFTFTLPDNDHIGDVLSRLHPTPAVCGLPKRESFQFIVNNEHTPRRYYSGFMGMLDPSGNTHLYVALRCMNIERGCCHLYAGGGLLPDSVEEQEWQETEAKLDTKRNIIYNV